MNKKLQIFKKYSKDKKFYNLPSCHDPLTAKLIEKKGFKISFIGGFALSSSSIGYPDASLITLSELVNSTRIICNQTKLPVVVLISLEASTPILMLSAVISVEVIAWLN